MPYVSVKVSQPFSPSLKQAITELLVSRTESILRKNRELTAIFIEFVGPQSWSIGGKSLADLGQHSVYVEIKVTEGTNTAEEKALYIEACFAAFERLLGPMHPASYITVHDLPAETWGYGGRTQAARRVN